MRCWRRSWRRRLPFCASCFGLRAWPVGSGGGARCSMLVCFSASLAAEDRRRAWFGGCGGGALCWTGIFPLCISRSFFWDKVGTPPLFAGLAGSAGAAQAEHLPLLRNASASRLLQAIGRVCYYC